MSTISETRRALITETDEGTTMISTVTMTKARLLLSAAAAAALALIAVLGWSSRAEAAFEDYDFAATDASLSTNQAGAHPDFVTEFTLTGDAGSPDGSGQPLPHARLRDVVVELPPGLLGNPESFPECSGVVFAGAGSGLQDPTTESCPVDSQVGVVLPGLWGTLPAGSFVFPLYNLEAPGGDVVARLGFYAAFYPTVVDITLDPARDNALTASIVNAPNAILTGAITEIWGVPTDPSHDGQRIASFAEPFACGGACEPKPSGLPPTAFMSNPTSCGPADVGFTSRSYADTEAVPTSAPLGNITGCESLSFDPTMTLRPTTTRADSSSGMDVDITLPQDGLTNPDGLATAHLRKTVVTLPEGLTLNPAAADGLGACSEAQVGLTSTDPIRFDAADPECPNSSKVGTAQITTPVLDDPLEGSLYVAEQDENPFGSLLAGYLVAKGRGVIIKVAGNFERDPETGQITAIFDGNPQQPFSELDLHFKGGARGVLATPPTCGAYDITTELTPWSGGAPVTQTSSFTIDQGPNGGECLAGNPSQPGDPADLDDRPFDLGFTAGVRNPQAASRSPFTVRVARPDGHQEIERLDTELPQGVAASLRGVPLCEESDAANANCGPESQIGTVQAAAGAGSNPFWVTDGKVFLTGPYKGAKLGLSIVVPAIAGPFDLGEVAVRAALFVDKADAHITVKSDPIPQILEGVPLRTREMRIRIDRPDFTLAGTSCTESQVSAEANGVNGASTQLAERFQLAGCRGLGFDPRFRFKAIGKRSTPRLAHPRLRATVRPRPRQGANANISRARVTLPRGIELDQSNIARPCTRPQFADDACPSRTQMGRAIARSPLLSDPLRGPVYLVTSDNELPDLLADLNGIVDVDLRGRIDTTRRTQRIRNTFALVPDVPVGFFRLNLRGGDRGLLVNSTDRCDNRRQNRIKVGTRGHNGGRADQRPVMRVRCQQRGQTRKGNGRGR